jgi:dipeptidyl aminopeptidase/acylaminoacyl peptidase
MFPTRATILSLALLLSLAPQISLGNQAAPAQTPSGYLLPDQAIVDVLDAPPPPGVVFSPDASRFLLVERPAMPSIADVAAPWVGLAGLLSLATEVRLRQVGSEQETPVQLPPNARIAAWEWSPDSRKVALLLAAEEGLELWLADGIDGSAKRLATGLNGVLGSPFGFVGSGEALWLLLVPADLKPPTPSPVPSGPAVQETSGSSAPLRTYQDLLASPEDEALFAYLATSQLALVQADSGVLQALGNPALISGINPSPDGKLLLVEIIEQPFSYVLPVSGFATRTAVWDRAGTRLLDVCSTPLADNIPMEGVPIGPRSVQWRATAPATLVWSEAQDGGDPAKPAELRDIWYAREAPFDQPARPLAKLAHRAAGIDWLQSSQRFIVGEYDRDRRWTRKWLYNDDGGQSAATLIEDRSRNDRYGDPGTPVSVLNEQGQSVVYERDNHILRAGPGHSPQGPRPFLASVSLVDGQRQLLWQSAADRYESMVELVHAGPDGVRFIYSSESATEPANYWLWTSGTAEAPSGTKQALTKFSDPTPQLRGISQELLSYQRADGVPLSGTLYLPAGYEPGTKLPLLIWAYPLEYTDTSTAGQVTNSTTRVLRMRGATHLAFLLAGYAVLDNATMPIVGDPETMNETFIEQIVAASAAAIDACVARGVADPEHVVVGGHSYGAFMTANLLAHCDLFRAGIARSGAYNRSLTPFGFQSERRTLWQAPETYIQLSPFFVAQKIDEPLLLIHGEKDSNPGTFPIQSERLYAAIKGNAGTARLVILPGEDHGYQARESALHTLAEMVAWCDRFVRPPRAPKATTLEAASPR